MHGMNDAETAARAGLELLAITLWARATGDKDAQWHASYMPEIRQKYRHMAAELLREQRKPT